MSKQPKLKEGLTRAGVASRTFEIAASDLKLWRISSTDTLNDTLGVRTEVWGNGCLGNGDTVTIVGTDLSTQIFQLRIEANTHAAKSWKRICAVMGEPDPTGDEQVDDRIAHWHRYTCDLANETPPTAIMFHVSEDRLEAVRESWGCELKIDPATFVAIEADLLAGRIHTLNIGVKWFIPLVSDAHLPRDFPHDWCMLPENCGILSESMHGTVVSVSWCCNLDPIHLRDPSMGLGANNV